MSSGPQGSAPQDQAPHNSDPAASGAGGDEARYRRPRPSPKPRRTWGQRLRSELLRQVSASLIGGVLAAALLVGLVAAGVLEAVRPELDSDATAVAVLAVFAFYGPAYLLLSTYAWRGLEGSDLRRALARTTLSDRGVTRSLFVGSPAQIASTAALLALLAVWVAAIRPGAPVALMLVSLACVCGSWILVMATFAVEYAREWANSDGFEFPGTHPRTFSDFLYLAVQASTTYGSADVAVTNRRARRLVVIHSITAFVFATVILAFLVAIVLNTVAA